MMNRNDSTGIDDAFGKGLRQDDANDASRIRAPSCGFAARVAMVLFMCVGVCSCDQKGTGSDMSSSPPESAATSISDMAEALRYVELAADAVESHARAIWTAFPAGRVPADPPGVPPARSIDDHRSDAVLLSSAIQTSTSFSRLIVCRMQFEPCASLNVLFDGHPADLTDVKRFLAQPHIAKTIDFQVLALEAACHIPDTDTTRRNRLAAALQDFCSNHSEASASPDTIRRNRIIASHFFAQVREVVALRKVWVAIMAAAHQRRSGPYSLLSVTMADLSEPEFLALAQLTKHARLSTEPPALPGVACVHRGLVRAWDLLHRGLPDDYARRGLDAVRADLALVASRCEASRR